MSNINEFSHNIKVQKSVFFFKKILCSFWHFKQIYCTDGSVQAQIMNILPSCLTVGVLVYHCSLSCVYCIIKTISFKIVPVWWILRTRIFLVAALENL